VQQSEINVNVLLTVIGESFGLKCFGVCLFCTEGYIKSYFKADIHLILISLQLN
jgi:hypothetical protein